MNSLKVLLITMSILYATHISSKECFVFDLKKDGTFQMKVSSYPKIKGQVYLKFAKVPKFTFQYDCWVTTQGISCGGDDDGGSFSLNIVNEQLIMTIYYLALRDEDHDLLLYRPGEATLHLGKKEKCSF